MPTNTKSRKDAAKALSDYYVYAPLGAGQLVFEKAAEVTRLALGAVREKRGDVLGAYRDLAKRGRALVSTVRRSPATRRADQKIDAARVNLRSTVKSARRTGRATTKAARATASAARSAAAKAS
jgi:hypothetical protein